MMDDMGHDTNQTLGESPGIVRPSATRGHLCTPLHGYAGKRTRSWRPGGPETRGTTACCIRSKSSRFVVHSFREGNTRTQFVFFSQLARQAGYELDATHFKTGSPLRDEFVEARFYSQKTGSNSRLTEVLGHVVRRAVPPAIEQTGISSKKDPR